jgi:two-component system response regulator RegX3
MHVLLVEDDAAISVPLVEALRLQGFEVTHVATGADALAAEGAEVVLLDLGLPDLDGMEICRRLRARSEDLAIIVVSARDSEIDRVMGFELGADDYVVKPFSTRELVGRIRAVTRRLDANRTGVEQVDQVIQSGGLRIERRARRVFLDGSELELTNKEFDLLAYLAEQPGVVRSRVEILTDVWDANWYGPTKTLDVHVAAVRRKLGDPRWIEAVRGVGFRFEPPR